MAGKIPLKLQVAIRDYWDKDTAAVQVARQALHDVLGYPVRIDPEWVQLLGALDAVYLDRQTLATTVAGCVELWCKVLTDLLDGADAADAAQQQWVEALMDSLQSKRHLRLFVDVAGTESGGGGASSASSVPGTAWSEEAEAFVLYLPQKKAVAVPGEFAAAYRGGLLGCFNKPASRKVAEGDASSLEHRPAEKQQQQSAGGGGGGDDWADVAVDTATGTAAVVDAPAAANTAAGPTTAAAAAKLEYLPSVDSLPRPDELFLRPPYHLIVSDYGSKKVVVQGSHSPSLHLLGEYMKRWCRLNHSDSRNPPAVEVKFNQSCWGASPMYDQATLTSEGNNIFQFNPTIVLAFVEGVLGYDLVSTQQGIWTYRRDVPFKG